MHEELPGSGFLNFCVSALKLSYSGPVLRQGTTHPCIWIRARRRLLYLSPRMSDFLRLLYDSGLEQRPRNIMPVCLFPRFYFLCLVTDLSEFQFLPQSTKNFCITCSAGLERMLAASFLYAYLSLDYDSVIPQGRKGV